METPFIDFALDARGLRCPLPILRAKKALAQLETGQVLAVRTTDPHAADDFKAFCQQSGNALLGQKPSDGDADSRIEPDAADLTHYIRRR